MEPDSQPMQISVVPLSKDKNIAKDKYGAFKHFIQISTDCNKVIHMGQNKGYKLMY